VNRWKFLLIYIPCALIVYGIEHVAGVKDGTGPSAAIGWGGGLVLALVVVVIWGWRGASWRAGARVERWRAEAANLRVDDVVTYRLILSEAATDDPRIAGLVQSDPDAFVALWLAAAADADK
jgi:hypothetical protein